MTPHQGKYTLVNPVLGFDRLDLELRELPVGALVEMPLKRNETGLVWALHEGAPSQCSLMTSSATENRPTRSWVKQGFRRTHNLWLNQPAAGVLPARQPAAGASKAGWRFRFQGVSMHNVAVRFLVEFRQLR